MNANTTTKITARLPKAELVRAAEDLGIEVPASWNKVQIVEAIQTTEAVVAKADGAKVEVPTYEITFVNSAKDGVDGHIAGCKDLEKVGKGNHDELAGTDTVTSKHEAWELYNSDFLAEDPSGDNAWDINWKACTNHVPAESAEETTVEELEELLDTNPWNKEPMSDEEAAEAAAELTAQVAAKAELAKEKEEKKEAPKAPRAPRRPEVREAAEGKKVDRKKNYTVKEVAELLAASPISVNRWVQMGKLTAVKSDPKEGRVVNLIPGTSVAEFLKGRADRAKATEKAKADKVAKAEKAKAERAAKAAKGKADKKA